MVFNKDQTLEHELHVLKFLPDSFEIQFELILCELLNIYLKKSIEGEK